MDLRKIYFGYDGLIITICGTWALTWLVEYGFFFIHWIQTPPFLVVPTVYTVAAIIHLGFRISILVIGCILYVMLKEYFQYNDFAVITINNGAWVPKIKTFLLGFECHLPICDQIKNLEQLETWKPFYIEFNYYSGKFIIFFYFFNSYTAHQTQYPLIKRFLERSFHEVKELSPDQLNLSLHKTKTNLEPVNNPIDICPEYFYTQNEFISFYNKINQKLFKNEEYVQRLRPGESMLNLKIQFWFFNNENIHFLWQQLGITVHKKDIIAMGGRISVEEISANPLLSKSQKTLNIHIPPKKVLIPDKTLLNIHLLLYIFNKWTTNYFSIDTTNTLKHLKHSDSDPKYKTTDHIKAEDLSEQYPEKKQISYTNLQGLAIGDTSPTYIPNKNKDQDYNLVIGSPEITPVNLKYVNTTPDVSSTNKNSEHEKKKTVGNDQNLINESTKAYNDGNKSHSHKISNFFNHLSELKAKPASDTGIYTGTDPINLRSVTDKINNTHREQTFSNKRQSDKNINKYDTYSKKNEEERLKTVTEHIFSSDDTYFQSALDLLSGNQEKFALEKEGGVNLTTASPTLEQFVVPNKLEGVSMDIPDKIDKRASFTAQIPDHISDRGILANTPTNTTNKSIKELSPTITIPDFKYTVVCRKYCKNYIHTSKEKDLPAKICAPYISKSLGVLEDNFVKNIDNCMEHTKLETLNTIISSENDYIQKTCFLTTILLQPELKKIFFPNEVYILLESINQELNHPTKTT